MFFTIIPTFSGDFGVDQNIPAYQPGIFSIYTNIHLTSLLCYSSFFYFKKVNKKKQ